MTTPQKDPADTRFNLPDILLLLGLCVLLCGEGYFGYRLHRLSGEQEQIKEDYSMLNNITFGIFSVDQWREKIATVVNSQVQDFSLTNEQKNALQEQVEQQLHGLVTKTVAEFNKPQHSLSGKLKKFAFNKFVNADKIQAQVPSFAKTIIVKVNSPASTQRLKNIATSKLDQLEKETYDSTELAVTAVKRHMYTKYRVSNDADFNKKTGYELSSIRRVSYNNAFAMLGCVLAALVFWWIMKKKTHLHTSLFIISLLFALIMLTVGITTSIIEVDARIKTLHFMLAGENVSFDNQVLFFQSKSLLSIVETLMKQPKPDAIVVGSLIFLFVMVLPVARIVARGIHILSTKEFAENKVVRYLSFESGKWDMADVMVVGIGMTYIGLNGILKSQLTNLNISNSFLTTTTVNNSSLQPGYYIFVGYVIFAFILSSILKRITPHDAA